MNYLNYDNAHKRLRFYSFMASIMVAIVSGAQYIYPIYGMSLIHQFHWSSLENSMTGMATFSGAVLFGPLCAYIVEKLQFKKTLLFASFTTLISLILLSETYKGNLPNHFIWCTIYLVLIGFSGAAAYLCALDSQAYNFKENRGITLGITSAALGMGGLFFSQVNDLYFNHAPSMFLIFYATCFFLATFSAAFLLGPIQAPKPVVMIEPPYYTQSLYSYSTSSTRYEEDGQEEEEEERPLLKNLIIEDLERQEMSNIEFFKDPIGVSLIVCLFVISGLGYIYLVNIGQILTSLLHNSSDDEQHLRNIHVSLYSLTNCGSRVVFGALSDVMEKKVGVHRYWFLWASSICLMLILIYLSIWVTSADQLIFCTTVIAIVYGVLFSLSPAIVSDFGEKTFARKWGWLMWAPAMGGQFYNMLFGIYYDKQSQAGECHGPDCFRPTFLIGVFSSIVCMIALSLAIYKKGLYHI